MLFLYVSDPTYSYSASNFIMQMLDTNGMIATWNLGAQRIKGYTAEEAIGKHFSLVYTPEDCAHGKPQFALSTAINEGRYEDEGLRVRKDGSTFWANVIITRTPSLPPCSIFHRFLSPL